jgi:predicted permease
VDLFLAICQGIGLALAAGIRPFLPALLAGAAASADLLIDFDHTGYEFLELPAFLLAVTAALVVVVLLERRLGEDRIEAGALGAALAGIGIGIGALLFAGSIDDETVAWPGLLAGIACAALSSAALRALFRRTRTRLDAAARAGLPFYANGVALLLAALSIVLPPVSLAALAFLAWLLLSGRRREGGKYAGLRILK